MADREQLAIADGGPGRACWPATGPSWAPRARTTYDKLIFDLASTDFWISCRIVSTYPLSGDALAFSACLIYSRMEITQTSGIATALD